MMKFIKIFGIINFKELNKSENEIAQESDKYYDENIHLIQFMKLSSI